VSRFQRAAQDGNPYRIALLDRQMAGMDGFEVARAIKAQPAGASVALVLLTSSALRGDARAAQAAGFAAYLSKPFRRARLKQALERVLGLANSPTSAPILTTHRLNEEAARRRPRALVAEDNVVNQRVAAHMLDRLGFRVDVVGNGLEAVEALRKAPYDIVLLDCMMPEMDGYEAAMAIRALPEPVASVPIVALTARALEGDRERCLAAGMNDFLSKPISLVPLRAMMDKWAPRDESDTDASESDPPMRAAA
jgi:CheY-like chemotaxis protein